MGADFRAQNLVKGFGIPGWNLGIRALRSEMRIQRSGAGGCGLGSRCLGLGMMGAGSEGRMSTRVFNADPTECLNRVFNATRGHQLAI